MKNLLEYILNELIGEGNFSLSESEEGGSVNYTVNVKESLMGQIIGKGGSIIKSIQDIIRVKARLENKSVYIKVETAS